LARFDGRHFHMLSEANNGPLSGITGIAVARNGDLWLNALDGVRRVAAAELRRAEKNPAYAVHADRYDLTDGLPSAPQRVRPFPTAVSSPDGRIWFGLRSGVVSVDPEDPSLSSPVPPVSIVRAIADGKAFDAAHTKLAARTKNLEIDYSAVSLNRAARVRFRYKLAGVDADWRDAGARRQAFYNDLPPGKYQFVVSASNGDNVWNAAGAAINMEVPPAFNQTAWFRSLCAAAFLALLFALYRLRLLYLTKQFNARLEGRESERARIARDLHDSLLQGFQGLLFRLQAVRILMPLRPADAARELETAMDLGDKALHESRSTVTDMRVSASGQVDLLDSLTALGKELSLHDLPKYRVLVEGLPRQIALLVRDEIYQIVREAVRNSLAHAQAQQIEVELVYGESEFRLRVRDDGIGFDSKIVDHPRFGHFGLQGMRERAESFGAYLRAWSDSGAGTEIELVVPARTCYGREKPPAMPKKAITQNSD
jgi:signal transduction histidine kinase